MKGLFHTRGGICALSESTPPFGNPKPDPTTPFIQAYVPKIADGLGFRV